MNQHAIHQNPGTSSRRWRLPLALVVAALLLGSTMGADIGVSTDADLESLKGRTDVEKLSLKDSSVTDAGLVHIAGLSGLTKLALEDTGVTDAGLWCTSIP